MSILIKGMDKPTDCGLCPFEDFGYCNVKGERNTSESGIDDDCPLIEVADRKTENSSEIPNNCEDCIWSVCNYNKAFKDEPQTEDDIARAIVHDIIDRSVIADDVYPDLRQRLHYAVDETEPQTERSEK